MKKHMKKINFTELKRLGKETIRLYESEWGSERQINRETELHDLLYHYLPCKPFENLMSYGEKSTLDEWVLEGLRLAAYETLNQWRLDYNEDQNGSYLTTHEGKAPDDDWIDERPQICAAFDHLTWGIDLNLERPKEESPIRFTKDEVNQLHNCLDVFSTKQQFKAVITLIEQGPLKECFDDQGNVIDDEKRKFWQQCIGSCQTLACDSDLKTIWKKLDKFI